jgi:transposase
MDMEKKSSQKGMRITINCPHCQSRTVAMKYQEIGKTLSEISYQCTDIECGHTFVATLRMARSLSPSAKPSQEVDLPLSPFTQRVGLLDDLHDELMAKMASCPALTIKQLCEWVSTEHGVQVSDNAMRRKLSSLGITPGKPYPQGGVLNGLETALIEQIDFSPTQSLGQLCQWVKDTHDVHVSTSTMRKKLSMLGVSSITQKAPRLLDGLEAALRKQKADCPGASIAQLCQWAWTEHGMQVGQTTMREKLAELGISQKSRPCRSVKSRRQQEDIRIGR